MAATSRTLLGVVGAALVALVASSVTARRLREELRICREDAQVLEERWSACRAELREARRLE